MAKRQKKPSKPRAARMVVNNDATKPECNKIGCRWPKCGCTPLEAAAAPAEAQPERHQQDVLVNIGSMKNSRVEQVILDKGYEAMVEDIIGNFNHIVSCGITPMTALFAMTQAYAVVLGCCLRADLDFEVAKKLQIMIMKNAQVASKAVRIITTP
jgi:hypothetical protein